MDKYLDELMRNKASMITIGKGNRTETAKSAISKHKGCYLGAIGGAGAYLAERCILDVKEIDFGELGMEAVRILTVKNFPAFIIYDCNGEDLFNQNH
jgi:fumarate hydratase class I